MILSNFFSSLLTLNFSKPVDPVILSNFFSSLLTLNFSKPVDPVILSILFFLLFLTKPFLPVYCPEKISFYLTTVC